jgi:chromosomal replication initiation ATPase DnaA
MDADPRAIASQLQSLLPDDVSPDLVFAISPPTLTEILAQVSAFYAVPTSLIIKHCRAPDICFARHVTCYLARTMTRLSHQQIGNRLGGFDITLSHYGHARVMQLREQDEIVRDDLDILHRRVMDAVLTRCATCH